MTTPHDFPDKVPDLGQPQLGLIIVAAGESLRMGGVDKIFTPLMGIPLIAHSVEPLAASPLIHSFVLVLSPENVEAGKRLADERDWQKLAAVCEGGARRQDSVKLGLDKLPPSPWVAVHDGARPHPGWGILERGLEAARDTGASIAAVRAKDTIKVVSESGLVEETPPRSRLWLVQTPQIFRYDLLMRAHDTCTETFTDDAAMVESLGNQVRVYEGAYTNLKVTTPEDLPMVEAALRASADTNLARTTPQATSI